MKRLRWAVNYAIDYGSIALVAFVAGFYLLPPFFTERDRYHPGLSGIATLLGLLLLLLAVKLWRDVRDERRRER
jgi:hypothetical protein